jgi:hypothetical protein
LARPKRSTEEEFYDVFSAWPTDDQAIALRVMEQIHRQAKRTKTLAVVTPRQDIPLRETLSMPAERPSQIPDDEGMKN